MNGKKSNQEKILVIDDNPTNLRVLLNYLTESGFETWIARSGKDALRQVNFDQPDIILLDVMMPDMDGFETCCQLKSNELTKDIPVIFMTALLETVDKVKGFEVGGVDFITKPLQQEEVLARITVHLIVQRQKRELYELNAMKNVFFSVVAHELRNSFTSLLGFSDLLITSVEKYDDDSLAEYIHGVRSSTDKTRNLLNNLLKWSRIQIGRLEFNPTKIDLSQVVTDTIESLGDQANQKEITLINHVQPNTSIYGDKNIVNTILNNLISNAIKFTNRRGEIKIFLDTNNDFAEISVSDTGVGIDEEGITDLFKIDKINTRKGTNGEKGTGLGLILCKDLVEKHQGKIWVRSEVGEGTTFTFALPQQNLTEDN